MNHPVLEWCSRCGYYISKRITGLRSSVKIIKVVLALHGQQRAVGNCSEEPGPAALLATVSICRRCSPRGSVGLKPPWRAERRVRRSGALRSSAVVSDRRQWRRPRIGSAASRQQDKKSAQSDKDVHILARRNDRV